MFKVGNIIKVIDEKKRFYPNDLTEQSYILMSMDDGYGNSNDIWCGVTGLNDNQLRYDSIMIFELDVISMRKLKLKKICSNLVIK